MSDSKTLNVKLFDKYPMTGDAISQEINKEGLDNMSCVVSWKNGIAPSGFLICQASNSKDNDPNQNWADLDFQQNLTISGATGNFSLVIREISFRKFRIQYFFTSGTGELTVELFGQGGV